MKASRLGPIAVFAVFVVAPIVVLMRFNETITVTPGRAVVLVLAAVGSAVAFVLFVFVSVQTATRRSRPASRPEQVNREINLIAATGVAVVITLALLLSLPSWQLAASYVAIAAAYVVIWIPPAARTLRFRTAVIARCTPEAAFELVSDPGNWTRYWPNLSVPQPPPLPLHVGDLIHDQVTTGTLTLAAVERVTDYDPPRAFGTAVVGPRGGGGVYRISEAEGGTEIAYEYRSRLMLAEAVLGSGWAKLALQRRLVANRALALDRIKRLLEEQPATTV